MKLFKNEKIFSEDETSAIAHEFAKQLRAGDVVVLNGNLGTGKTFFTKKALEIFEIANVSSPTFALVNEYNGKTKVYHFDFYRINSERELFDIGFNDYLNDDEAISFIEWGEMFPSLLPSYRFEVNIKLNEDFSREITIEKYE